jgi:ATP-dependent RNA helicase DeaD
MEKFKKLGLSEALLKAILEEGYEAPREIQEKAIPLALAGKDIIGGSATGSGKTLAFGAGIIEKSVKGAGIQALILTPTRELADQVAMALRGFSKFKGLRVIAIYGGVAMSPQIDALERAEIVVGTPGRILDHLRQGTLDLRKVSSLVLDEADRMLDMGFIEDVETIIAQCPKERQTFLFSATISPDISHIAKRHMNHPIDISGEEMVDPSKLKQIFYDVPSNQKFSLLVHLLRKEHAGLVMIFCNTRHNTDFVAHNLMKNNIDATAIHGGLTQGRRSKIMELFKTSSVHALVCTDVAARGLDIEGVSHVYNYDSPKTSKEYIHRIGRTARAGKDGIAISIVSNRDYENFNAVIADSDIKIEQQALPTDIERAFMQINVGREDRGSFGGRGGGRSFGGRSGGRSFGGRSGGFRGGGRSFGGRGRERRDGDGEGRRESRGGFGGRSGGRSFGGRSGGRSFGGRSSGRSFGGGGRGRRY